jgi:glutamyl-tRNA synthetase
MSKSGALFDIAKMESVSNAYLSRISTQQLYAESLERAKIYKPDLATLMASDPTYAQAALGIERHTPKDPKRFTTYADIEPQLRFFFDSERERLRSEVKPIVLSTSVDVSDVMKNFVAEYITVLDLTMNVEDWFAQLKEIGKKYGFASNNAEFKAG